MDKQTLLSNELYLVVNRLPWKSKLKKNIKICIFL